MHQLEDSVNGLIASFQRFSVLQPSKNGQQTVQPLITPVQLYQTGLVLYESPHEDHLIRTYQELIERLPYSYLNQILLHELSQAYSTIVTSWASSNDKADDIHAVITASRALAGVYCNAPAACRAGQCRVLIQALGVAYEQVLRASPNHAHIVLEILAAILMDGVLYSDTEAVSNMVDLEDEEQRLQTIMEAIQMLTADEKNTCVADLQEMQSRKSHSISLKSKIETSVSASPQRDYLLRMIATPSKNNTPDTKPNLKTAPKTAIPPTKPSVVDPRDEIRRRIRQVQLVLPDLGAGYVEAALSAFQGSVERTLAALVDGTSLPPTLQRLDPSLPGRAMETTPNGYVNDDEEARQISKDRIRKMEQDQEAEAYALTVMRVSEYNDDYDDQYDDFDGGAAVGDSGGLDVDIDTVKMYNRIARETENEVKFWNESRNTNRAQIVPHTIKGPTTDDDVEDAHQKQFRGPDKIKGGRLLGPDGKVLPRPKVGKQAPSASPAGANTKPSATQGGTKISNGTANVGTKAGETELTKLQKRRKMLNKAKTGNHHRKDAAQRKTGGMG